MNARIRLAAAVAALALTLPGFSTAHGDGLYLGYGAPDARIAIQSGMYARRIAPTYHQHYTYPSHAVPRRGIYPDHHDFTARGVPVYRERILIDRAYGGYPGYGYGYGFPAYDDGYGGRYQRFERRGETFGRGARHHRR